VALALLGLRFQMYFLSLLMVWYVMMSYRQWQLFRAFRGPDN
jgi:hypothetical protein